MFSGRASVPAYDSYLEALCKGGNLDEAYKIFQEMDSNGIDNDACVVPWGIYVNEWYMNLISLDRLLSVLSLFS